MAPFHSASNTTPSHPQHLLLLPLRKTDRLRQSNFNRLFSPAFRLNFTTSMVNGDNFGPKVMRRTKQTQSVCVCFNPPKSIESYVYCLLCPLNYTIFRPYSLFVMFVWLQSKQRFFPSTPLTN